jgi:hypothetical protein
LIFVAFSSLAGIHRRLHRANALLLLPNSLTFPGTVKRRRRIVDERVDTRVIRACIGGKGVKAIAAELRISPERVENILEEWTASAVSPELRRQQFVRLLAQIDAVIEGLFPRAVAGEPAAITVLNKNLGSKNWDLGPACAGNCDPAHHRRKRAAGDERRQDRACAE